MREAKIEWEFSRETYGHGLFLKDPLYLEVDGKQVSRDQAVALAKRDRAASAKLKGVLAMTPTPTATYTSAVSSGRST
jgi:hypothetical protein